ncbi:MAG: mevalonate kinase [Gammaproteobacteria bacterium]|nr:mevalonate kinase [Gammaproteobacteria bacterium]
MKKAIAPGKLILSGEHAVVYGQPALAMAINRYAEAWVSEQQGHLISFDLLNLKYHKAMTMKALHKLKHRVQEGYNAFLQGEAKIRDVLKLPAELSKYAFTHLLEKVNHQLADGVKLSTHSTIPVGCGMGSSAAMILCVMHAVALQQGLSLSFETYLEHAKDAENIQHGRSSGLDLQVSLRGGCLRFQEGVSTKRPLPNIELFMVNTGKPENTTGECVSVVAKTLDHPALLADFAAVTQAMDEAIEKQELNAIQHCIRTNHQLLTHIGVVPSKVQQFISAIEAVGGAAKICGAGAISGDQAGIVLIAAELAPKDIVQQFNYTLETVQGELQGLHSIVGAGPRACPTGPEGNHGGIAPTKTSHSLAVVGVSPRAYLSDSLND